MFLQPELITKNIPPFSNDKILLKTRIDFYKSNNLKYITTEYKDFISAFENSIEKNQSVKILGLDKFLFKDVIIGCQHFLDNLIMEYGLHNLQFFEGGYGYFKKLNKNLQYTTLKTLQSGKPLLLEYPFPRYQSEHPQYKEIIQTCNEKNIDVYLDCAWLPVSFGLELELNQPCIKGLAMSLSKCYGLHWNRIGVRWYKNEKKDSIFLQNENRMISYSNLMIGKFYLDRLPIDYLVKKYKNKYIDICKKFDLLPGNTILVARSKDKQKLYSLKNSLLHKED